LQAGKAAGMGLAKLALKRQEDDEDDDQGGKKKKNSPRLCTLVGLWQTEGSGAGAAAAPLCEG
jgi:hypothetical protein